MERTIHRVGKGECVSPVEIPAWGERLAAVPDPDVVKLPWTGVRPTLAARLPSELWRAWLALAWRLCRSGSGERNEVGILLLRSAAPPHDLWRALVPSQRVDGGALTYDLSTCADLVTGELCSGIPDGWLHAGTSHSHHEMGAFFSATDNRDELDIPGLHVVIGRIDKRVNTYACEASIVDGGRRYSAELESFVASEAGGPSGTFHESVLELIDEHTPVVYALPERSARSERGRMTDAELAAMFRDHARDDDAGSTDLRQDYLIGEISDMILELDRAGINRVYAILADAESELAEAALSPDEIADLTGEVITGGEA